MRMQLITGLLMATAFGAAAHASEFVQNGGFELLTGAPSTSFEYDPAFAATGSGTGTVNNWSVVNQPGQVAYNILERDATATTIQPANRFSGTGQNQDLYALPSNTNTAPFNVGNNFMALDGDPGDATHQGVQGALQQTINGLTVGATYRLTFDFAADQLQDRTGPTTEYLHVSLDGQSHDTDVLHDASQSATPWELETMFFTATSTSEVLSFLSVGTPTGEPPVALLDNVSLQSVPEPATWGLMMVGVAAIGASLRMRRRAAATLA
jgi:hypothetical protein